jgi:hypothetical protein
LTCANFELTSTACALKLFLSVRVKLRRLHAYFSRSLAKTCSAVVEMISQWLTGKKAGIVLEHATKPWFYVPLLSIMAVIFAVMVRSVIRRQIHLTRIVRGEGDEIPYWDHLP